MNFGQGAISFVNLTPPSLSSASANNGLSYDIATKKIVLGQSIGDLTNPAITLDEREILIGTGANGIRFRVVNEPGRTRMLGASIIVEDPQKNNSFVSIAANNIEISDRQFGNPNIRFSSATPVNDIDVFTQSGIWVVRNSSAIEMMAVENDGKTTIGGEIVAQGVGVSEFFGSIRTGQTGNDTFNFGQRITLPCVFDPTAYVSVEINGVAYQLALCV